MVLLMLIKMEMNRTSVCLMFVVKCDRVISVCLFSEVVSCRQTFVFSATLTFVPTKPQRLDFAKKKKKFHQITTKEKLGLLFVISMHEMLTILTNVHSVCLSVSQSVRHAAHLSFTVEKWLNRSRCCLG